MPKETEAQRPTRYCNFAALFVSADCDFRAREVVEIFASAFETMGDEVDRIRLQPAVGRVQTMSLENFRKTTEIHDSDWTNIWVRPRSERGKRLNMWLSAGIGFNYTRSHRTLFLGMPAKDSNSADTLHGHWWSSAVSKLKVTYGFGFERRYGHGPEYFVMGIDYSELTEPDNNVDQGLVRLWAHDRQGDLHDNDRYRFERGKILAVFPLNLLTTRHLNNSVGSKTLREWILSDEDFGDLRNIGSDRFVWTVPKYKCQDLTKLLSVEGLCLV